MKLLVIINVGSDVTDQLLIRFSAFVRYWKKNGSRVNSISAIHDFKKAYDSVKSELLYNILIEFGVPMKLFRLIKMFLNYTYSKIHTGKHLSDSFPIQNGLTRRCSITTAFELRYRICQ
jgi:hypothetical protein